MDSQIERIKSLEDRVEELEKIVGAVTKGFSGFREMDEKLQKNIERVLTPGWFESLKQPH